MWCRWYVFILVVLCLMPGWVYARGNSCEIRDIRLISGGPDMARFQVSYSIPPAITGPCFIGAYVPDMTTPGDGFRYEPAGALPEGIPKGVQNFHDAVSFSVSYSGAQTLTTSTIEVILFEKDKILCSRTFVLQKRWETHGSITESVRLTHNILARSAVELEGLDRDRDGLIDEAEGELADACRPYLRFDSDEKARAVFEPVTLFQVRPVDLRAPGNFRIKVVWAFLYRQNGGYGPDSWCGGGHAGDITTAGYELSSQDGGVSWSIVAITLGQKENLIWRSGAAGLETYGAHPVLFVSAGRHNLYFSKDYDHRGSRYSFWGCREDVNGQGVLVMPDLASVWGDTFNNVGEPESHPGPPFINSLDKIYAGQSVWETQNFYSRAAGRIHRLWVSTPWQGGISKGYRIQAYGYPERFIRHRRFMGELTRLYSSREKQSATFRIIPGLADDHLISFEAVDHPGYFLCVQDFRIKLIKPADEGTRRDATFKKVRGLAKKSCTSFESSSHPEYFIRQRDFHIVLEKGGDDQFRTDATFCIGDPE